MVSSFVDRGARNHAGLSLDMTEGLYFFDQLWMVFASNLQTAGLRFAKNIGISWCKLPGCNLQVLAVFNPKLVHTLKMANGKSGGNFHESFGDVTRNIAAT